MFSIVLLGSISGKWLQKLGTSRRIQHLQMRFNAIPFLAVAKMRASLITLCWMWVGWLPFMLATQKILMQQLNVLIGIK